MEILDSLLFMLAEMAPYILLGFLIAGLMHAFVPQRIMARHLASPGFGSVCKAALLGIPLPLCSCGVLPTAVALRRGGASRAATTSFLVATPQTGVDSIAATYSMLGSAFAIIRPIAALITALGAGLAVGVSEKKDNADSCASTVIEEGEPETASLGKRCLDALKYGFVDLVGSIGGWLVAGLIIAALITVYVPADFFAALGDRPLLAMLAVVVVAIPMYVCATGSIPIAMSLMLKGLSPGTALVLLMAGPAANFASFTLISREMGKKAATLYLAAIIAGAIGFGLIIDYLLPANRVVLPHIAHGACHTDTSEIFPLICAGIMAALLLVAFGRRFFRKSKTFNDMTQIYVITGMNCPHCQASVEKAISSVPGVTQVEVNLSTGRATVEGNHDPETLKRAVSAAGFNATQQ
ncbi:MAG: SO_0444 family Cu/Zn efflux transporter [Prevotella sp.]|nr:SO_0444 family Cu/Zn efflux transporter [Prevotella sp.]MCM1075320.1 SO_0444 family Cu/Zn efflux transporter [Ruminococcus sp.]